MERVRITSDGTTAGTAVYDHQGQLVTDVIGIRWEFDPLLGSSVATIERIGAEDAPVGAALEAELDADVRTHAPATLEEVHERLEAWEDPEEMMDVYVEAMEHVLAWEDPELRDGFGPQDPRDLGTVAQ